MVFKPILFSPNYLLIKFGEKNSDRGKYREMINYSVNNFNFAKKQYVFAITHAMLREVEDELHYLRDIFALLNTS